VIEEPRRLLEIDPLPHLGVVVAYGRIIPAEVLERVPMVNLHFSLLPRWRGAAPVERALLAGDLVTGVCLMEVVEELDAGGVYDRRELAIGESDSATDLRNQLVDQGIEMLRDRLQHGLGQAIPQSGEVTYADKITTDDLRIDWSAGGSTIGRLVRVGGAWTTFRDKRIKLLEAEVIDGRLVPLVVQPEGRRPMNYTDWRRGIRFEPGEWFV
jgi:methionyl-tRNA formyltransferase